MAQQYSDPFPAVRKGYIVSSVKKPRCEYVTRTGNQCMKNALEGENNCMQHRRLQRSPQITELPPSPKHSNPRVPHPETPSQQETSDKQSTPFQLTPQQIAANERLRQHLNSMEDISSENQRGELNQKREEEMAEEAPAAPKFDPRSFRSKAVDMALADEQEYYEQENRRQAVSLNPVVGVMCGGYYIGASVLEDASKRFMSRPLTGFESQLRANPEVQEYLPIVMQNIADSWGVTEISPEKALIMATAMVAFSCYVSSVPIPQEKKQEMPDELVPEESL